MADGWELERGFEYHANLIYNRPELKNKRNTNPDWVTSLAVVEFIVELMREWGCDRTYYHDRDALPGGNVFTEIFTTIKKSSYTIVIVTKGFVVDCWGMYKSQAAFIKLLQKSNRFIAVYIDIDNHHIPDEFCTVLCMSFSANWRDEREEWNMLRNLIRRVPTPIQDTGQDRFPDLRSTINTELQHSQRNLTSGVQETQPPNLTRAGGSNVLADGPLNGNVLADGPSSADVALNTIPFSAQSPVDDRQNLSNVRINNHSFNDNQKSLRSSAPTQSMSENSTSSEESTTNRLSNDPSDMTTTSNRAPPNGEANATTSGLAQGQSSQTIQREDSVDTNVKRLVSNENQNGDDLIDSSLNQTDIEADNQASGQLNSVDTPAPQDDSRLGLDLASPQRSDNSVNISPESIGANRCNDQTTAGYRSPVQTPTITDPDNPSFFNWMTSLVPDKERRIKAARYFTNMLVKLDQSFM